MAPTSPDSHVPEYGSLVGSWRVGKQVGKGSYGVVFRAVHKDRPEAGPVPDEPSWRTWVLCLALAGGCLVMALLCALPPRDVHREEVAFTVQDSEPQVPDTPDAGTAVGEEGLASVSPAEKPQVSGSEGKVSREVPEKPRNDQKRPPCNQRGAVEINGGCWRFAGKGAETAPCDSDLYEHEGRCYSPILDTAERIPTSDEPQ